MHDITPDSGGKTFNQAINTRIDEECIKISGSPQTHYHSVDNCVQLMANSSTCATHLETVAANHLYYIQIRITFAGELYPTPPGANTCDILYSNEYYSSLHHNNPHHPVDSSFTLNVTHCVHNPHPHVPLYEEMKPSRLYSGL